jgi:hypothetical protein
MTTLKEQLEITRKSLEPEGDIHQGLIEFCNLVEKFEEYMEQKYAQENHGEGGEIPY